MSCGKFDAMIKLLRLLLAAHEFINLWTSSAEKPKKWWLRQIFLSLFFFFFICVLCGFLESSYASLTNIKIATSFSLSHQIVVSFCVSRLLLWSKCKMRLDFFSRPNPRDRERERKKRSRNRVADAQSEYHRKSYKSYILYFGKIVG